MTDSSPEPFPLKKSPSPAHTMDISDIPLAPHLTHLRPPSQHRDEGVGFIPDYDRDDRHSDSDLKRAADDVQSFRPLKRQKGALNGNYLDLLNAEIEDAALRIDSLHHNNEELGRSQFGLTDWTEIEKRVFFESISRLGRDDAPAIAARIGTKGELEVKVFIQEMEDAKSKRDFIGSRQLLARAEHPAAFELSQQCCHALDEAADAVSLRQERREQRREESKWGEVWDLTPEIARRLQKGDEDLDGEQLPSLKLFNLRNWLKLCQIMFMNSSIPGDNWNHVDNKPPSIWATTMEDLYSLTVSITKRIVQTAIFAASTRIRARGEYRDDLRNHVRREDVAAALASLNMPADADEFWRKSARRLRINVYDEDDEDNDEPMCFDDVENALGDDDELDAMKSGHEEKLRQMVGPYDNDEVDAESTSSEDSSSRNSKDSEGSEDTALKSEENKAIEDEANEVFVFSAATYSETRRLKAALEHRIAVEREQERFAEEVDQHTSYKEETEMWKLLQKTPPFEIPKKSDPGRPQKSVMDVESMYPLGRNWRNNTQYRGEWEQAVEDHTGSL